MEIREKTIKGFREKSPDLRGRMHKHRVRRYSNSFSKRHNCVMPVWYNYCDYIGEAIIEEKTLKAGNRKKELIHTMNPGWVALWESVKGLSPY